MKKKFIFILVLIISFLLLTMYLLNLFISNLDLNFDLYYEDHSVQKGEVTLNQYYENNHCFSEYEKQMISNRTKIVNVFDNEVFQVSECGDLGISFNVKDYDSTGDLYLYSNSSFENLKKWIITNNKNDNIIFYDTWISILDSDGEIRFYKNNDNFSFRIIYITKLPYRYRTSELDTYSEFIKYFLEINLKNID